GIADLESKRELLLQIVRLYVLHPGIEHDLKRLGLALTPNGELHGVLAGGDQWSLRALTGIEGTGNLERSFGAQVPGIAVHAGTSRDGGDFLDLVGPLRWLLGFFLFFAGKCADNLAVGADDLQLHFVLWRGFEVVVNDRSCRRVVTHRAAAVDGIRIVEPHGG